jgi:hypothetical protein
MEKVITKDDLLSLAKVWILKKQMLS